MAFSDVDGLSVPVRVLFDRGSQLSYITEKLQNQLRLKPVKIEKLHLILSAHVVIRPKLAM